MSVKPRASWISESQIRDSKANESAMPAVEVNIDVLRKLTSRRELSKRGGASMGQSQKVNIDEPAARTGKGFAVRAQPLLFQKWQGKNIQQPGFACGHPPYY
jgi:hypothetical protein